MAAGTLDRIGNLIKLRCDVGLIHAGTYGIVLCNLSGSTSWVTYLVLIEGEKIACFDHELELVSEYDDV